MQTARLNAGGTRVELGRERVILDTYRNALGPNGPLIGRGGPAGLPRGPLNAVRSH